MAIPGAFPRIAIHTFTLSINHLHIQYGNMTIKTTHSNFFLFFLHQSNDIPRPKTPYGKYSHHEDKYICSNTTYEDSTAMSLQSHIP